VTRRHPSLHLGAASGVFQHLCHVPAALRIWGESLSMQRVSPAQASVSAVAHYKDMQTVTASVVGGRLPMCRPCRSAALLKGQTHRTEHNQPSVRVLESVLPIIAWGLAIPFS